MGCLLAVKAWILLLELQPSIEHTVMDNPLGCHVMCLIFPLVHELTEVSFLLCVPLKIFGQNFHRYSQSICACVPTVVHT